MPVFLNDQIFSAEYMHERGDIDAPQEPDWLHYRREWGPKIENDKNKFDEVLKIVPLHIRNSLEDFFEKYPAGVLDQEGRTGPREKNIWLGDEEPGHTNVPSEKPALSGSSVHTSSPGLPELPPSLRAAELAELGSLLPTGATPVCLY